MSPPGRRMLVTAIAGVSYLGWALGLVVAYRVESAGGVLDVAGFVDGLIFSLAWLGFPAVGGVLAIRRPDTPVGWMMLLIGCCFYALEPVTAWAEYVATTGAVLQAPLLWSAAIVNALAMLPVLGFGILLLAFPDGLATRLGRGLAAMAVVITTLVTLVRLLRPGDLDAVEVANPFGLRVVPEDADISLVAVLFGITAVAFVRLVLRHRGADRVERKQLQWVLTAVATFPLLWIVGNAVEGVNYAVGQFTAVSSFALAFLGFAVALYRAVTRHDLYGIDRLVSRTLTYALLTGVLVATYLGLVLGLGGVARAVTGESGDLVVALSTLAVAALAQPARRRVHAVVDRRFNRASYDAARTIDEFGRGLRDELGLTAVVEQLGRTAATTFRPRFAGVTLVATEVDP